MPGKAKMQKHTAASLAKKDAQAKAKNGGVGGGAAGIAGRRVGGEGNPKCPHCNVSLAFFKDMKAHMEAKHPKEPFDEPKWKEVFAAAKAAATADKAKSQSGKVPKAKKERGPVKGNTDALPAELLAAMAGMGPKKGGKKK